MELNKEEKDLIKSLITRRTTELHEILKCNIKEINTIKTREYRTCLIKSNDVIDKELKRLNDLFNKL